MSAEQIAQKVRDGDVRSAARVMRWLDDGNRQGIEVLKLLYPYTGKAWVIGLTGSPGAGKSTLTDSLIAAYRAQDQKVGVVAVDPTSPFSGGAILGDRIRMQRHETDPGVFIRSVATRGSLGGLSRSTAQCVHVLDAFGCDIILIETVGVGQDEVDIVREADTSIVVTVPGMGDDIQAIKAGIMEIADLFVINKADRDGTDRTEKELRIMMDLIPQPEEDWKPSITRTIAVHEQGIDKVVSEIQRHRNYMDDRNIRKREAPERATYQAINYMGFLLEQKVARISDQAEGKAILDQIATKELDPYSAAEKLFALIASS